MAMAAKLTASSSSAEMLSSLLPSLVAEEAASKNGLLASSRTIQKRQKLDNPASTLTLTYYPPFPPSMPMPAPLYIQTSTAMPFMFPENSMSLPPGTVQVPQPPLPPVPPPQQQQTKSLSFGYRPVPGNGFYGQQQLQSVPPASRQ